jgi:hypothetical protein
MPEILEHPIQTWRFTWGMNLSSLVELQQWRWRQCVPVKHYQITWCHMPWNNLHIIAVGTSNLMHSLTMAKKKVTLSLCIINWAWHLEYVQESGVTDPWFLNLSTRWRWVVKCAPQAWDRTSIMCCTGISVGPRANLDAVMKSKSISEEWCLLGCYVVWLL